MARRRKKVDQPPINRHGRPSESRPFYVGIIAAVVSVGLLGIGAVLQYRMRAAKGVEIVPETRLIELIRTGAVYRNEVAEAPAESETEDDQEPAKLRKDPKPDDFCPT